MKNLTLIVVYLLFVVTLYSQDSTEDVHCRKRLPQLINSYQPVIVPVLSIDGKYLYFDRKLHPENAGGVKDEDDIWFSARSGLSWQEPHNMVKLNTIESDILFSVLPDGRALLYAGNREEKGSPFRLINLYNIKEKSELLNIRNYYNDTSNYYAGISADGNILLLSLQRNDSRGNLDLYVSFREQNTNNFSEPVNLGNVINTPGLDGSPFLAYDNKTLYFISNGRKGFGKLDIYMSRRLDSTWQNWSEPVNLGKEVNTEFNENGIWLTALGDTAYIISSDTTEKRQGIYSVCIPKEYQPFPYVVARGKIYVIDNNVPVLLQASANIAVNILDNSKVMQSHSNPLTGEYYLVLPSESDYNAVINYGGFLSTFFTISTRGVRKPEYMDKDVVLKGKAESPEMKHVQSNSTKVFFGFDSAKLQKNEKDHIDNFFKDLNIKGKKIKISGFTDTTGTEKYNKRLSLHRAKSVATYLRRHGINKNQYIVEGLGESRPPSARNDEDRRVEIVILEK